MSHQRQDRDDTAIPPLTSAHSFAEKGCATVGRQAQTPANEGGTTGPGGPSLVLFHVWYGDIVSYSYWPKYS